MVGHMALDHGIYVRVVVPEKILVINDLLKFKVAKKLN